MNSDIQKIKKYVRATNYLTAAQIYLQDNFLLDRELKFDDIKPRLLGHWGTCPGINFVYANLNYVIKKHELSMLFVLGPGHGFPALQANLFLEKTLEKYYPDARHDELGLNYICKNFSWPYGFPSHSNPGAPGAILEGGELGYSLSTSYGAVLDNPDLIVSCLIGDGEAETGALATAWHLSKFIDPVNDGAVLPILHLNGYKISGPTIFGRMSDRELHSLFYGYGYEPIIVDSESEHDVYEEMNESLEKSLKLIKEIQTKARSGIGVPTPRFPMIILKTPKGWTGIKELKGEKIEGNNLSHQVVGMESKTDDEELRAVEEWMRSYHFNSLFNPENGFTQDILDIVPSENLRMGENSHAYSGRMYQPLLLPDVRKFAEDATIPGTVGSSSMKRSGEFLNAVFNLNERNKNLRLMSPDETYSNKLDEVFKSTARQFELPIESWDKDLATYGRVMEMLSEHSLQGLAQGYILTGRHALFASYEAFIQIISSMADQYAKFLKVANETQWRGDMACINYILTSSGWRQDHNGFSHQNPGFISDILEKEYPFVKAYFPADGNSTLVVLKHCLESKNGMNIIVAGKTLEPRWLTVDLAEKELKEGLMVWDFASDNNPDIILTGIGDYVTKEVMAAIDVIKTECPEAKVRCVNVVDVTRLHECDFETFFTNDKPVIFNFHGYPDSLKKLLFDRNDTERFSIHGYIENGSTTTPFDMHVRNRTSRWHLAMEAFLFLAQNKVIPQEKSGQLIKKYQEKLDEHRAFIIEHSIDPDEVEKWTWKTR
jgi:xylulose-5-phosphate/fructose-6-phosphate phosphoketolase